MKFLGLISVLAVGAAGQWFTSSDSLGGYDPEYVSFETEQFDEGQFHIVSLDRTDEHVKVKYFASKLGDKSVEDRFNEWKQGKNVILYTSGAYMSELGASTAGIVGLTIDGGKISNDKFSMNKMNALVMVYPDGSIRIEDIGGDALELVEDDEVLRYNMHNSMHVERFVDWAAGQQLTVFQTHLLIIDDELRIAENSSDHRAERRFLAQATNAEGEEFQFIVHMPDAATLYNGTLSVQEYLYSLGYTDLSLINLDTGAQDVFRFFDVDGEESEKLQGRLDVSSTRNLMVYYFE